MPETQLAHKIAASALGIETEGTVQTIGMGRGVFSTVYRVDFGHRSVVVKMPRTGPNGDVARSMGAYDREVTAYRDLLVVPSELPVPRCFRIHDTSAGPAFVLEDLTSFGSVDQLDGLSGTDVGNIVDALVTCHLGLSVDHAHQLGVRTATPRNFAPDALERGVDLVPDKARFRRLLDQRAERVEYFSSLTEPVVCHGDPRADNLVLEPSVKLFDWQQIAIQAGEADLAWLLSTSLEPAVRRTCERSAVDRYADAVGRSRDESWDRYRAGLVVPGLAVLMLAQRSASGRLAKLVQVSIERIAAAVADHF